MTGQTALLLERAVARELSVCIWLNHACHYESIRRLFATVSWLGDGKFWYSLILMLPLFYGQHGIATSIKMAGTGIIGLIIYKLIKAHTHRLRPFMVHQEINLGTSPLDQYSFPSGHTLHAVNFTILAVQAFPELTWTLVPVTILIALSRVMLGLHYPSDVAIGAVIGAALAFASLSF